jgi:hypothetical protein
MGLRGLDSYEGLLGAGTVHGMPSSQLPRRATRDGSGDNS